MRLYALQDANWNVVALCDIDGAVLERYTYDGFGKRNALMNSGIDFEHGFTGQVLDAETGLMLYRNRYYSTALGRFISRDPIGYEAGDGNLYRYVGNVPNRFVDPAGMQTKAGAGVAAGAVAANLPLIQQMVNFGFTSEVLIRFLEMAGATGLREKMVDHYINHLLQPKPQKIMRSHHLILMIDDKVPSIYSEITSKGFAETTNKFYEELERIFNDCIKDHACPDTYSFDIVADTISNTIGKIKSDHMSIKQYLKDNKLLEQQGKDLYYYIRVGDFGQGRHASVVGSGADFGIALNQNRQNAYMGVTSDTNLTLAAVVAHEMIEATFKKEVHQGKNEYIDSALPKIGGKLSPKNCLRLLQQLGIKTQ